MPPKIRDKGKCFGCSELQDVYLSGSCGHPMCESCSRKAYSNASHRDRWDCPVCKIPIGKWEDALVTCHNNPYKRAAEQRESSDPAIRKIRKSKDVSNKRRWERRHRAKLKKSSGAGSSSRQESSS